MQLDQRRGRRLHPGATALSLESWLQLRQYMHVCVCVCVVGGHGISLRAFVVARQGTCSSCHPLACLLVGATQHSVCASGCVLRCLGVYVSLSIACVCMHAAPARSDGAGIVGVRVCQDVRTGHSATSVA